MSLGLACETQRCTIDILGNREDNDVDEVFLPAGGPTTVVSHRRTGLVCELIHDRVQAVRIADESWDIECRRGG